MSHSTNLRPGGRLGRYTVGEPLGSGATASVHTARDPDGREMAVKVRRRGIDQLDRRFLREFESMRTLRLPGVVRVYEAGIEGDLLWFSMDLVRGDSFRDAVLAEPTIRGRVARVADLGRQLIDILGALHQAGFVHRDVKPSNVLVDADGQVRVLDFGIARFYGDLETLSDSGQVLGTIPFMAPEQLAGLPFDHRADLFAAGILLYESIDGPRPRPSTQVGWIPRICLERLLPLACKHRDVPRMLSQVVEHLTRVDPDERIDAAAAASLLRRVHRGADTRTDGDWPEPPWVDTGDWWADLEGCIGNKALPAVALLDGPSGSGRRRVAEQLHRQAIMQGVWPIHVDCQIDAVGQPIVTTIERILASDDDAAWPKRVLADDAEVLRRMWPHLPVPDALGEGGAPPAAEVAVAAARAIARAASRRPLLLVFRGLERVDELTAEAIAELAELAGPRLGLLLLHELRWGSTASSRLIERLKPRTRRFEMPTLSQAHATAVAAALCPEAPPTVPATSAQRAVEAGLEALAAWRGEVWPPPDSGLWPLAVRDAPLPDPVLARIGGPHALDGPWIRRGDGTVEFVGATGRRCAELRLADLSRSARLLEEAWVAALGAQTDPGEIARLRLLAGDPQGAWAPALESACRAEAVGRYAEARTWLGLLDTLPLDRAAAVARTFDLALVRARVALRTDAGTPRIALVDAAEQAASATAQEQLVRVLRAEYQLRSGEVRPGLVTALRIASPLQSAPPQVAVRALIVATHARFLLGQFDEVPAQLERARLLLADAPEPRLEVQVTTWAAQLAYRRGDLAACQALLQGAIRVASQSGYVRGTAFASSRFAQVLRALGRRREAEHQMRSAREAFQATSDLALGAETALELAMLRAERGDAAGASALLDDAMRRANAMGQKPLIKRAMKVMLTIATLRADPTDAAMALDAVDPTDPEVPAVIVRWCRTRGDTMQALAVEAPPAGTYGHVAWQVERARAALAGGQRPLAAADARAALEAASTARFSELEIYARLLLGVLEPVDEPQWRDLLRQASTSLFTEVYLGSLEMDARRLAALGDGLAATARWRALRARAEELGYRPGVEEAGGWLTEVSTH